MICLEGIPVWLGPVVGLCECGNETSDLINGK
jgi:hypothetical protein